MARYGLLEQLSPIILLIFLYASYNPVNGLEIKFADLKSFEVRPVNPEQLQFLKELRNSDSGFLFWNGIGDIEEPVQFLASPVAVIHFSEDFRNIDLEVTISSINAELTIGELPKEIHNSGSSIDNESKDLKEQVPVKRIEGTALFSGLFYRIGMEQFPEGWVTWTNQRTRDRKNNYVQIDLNPDNLPYYKKGQKWYDDIQWTFTPSDNKEGFFTLRNKQDVTSRVNTVQEGNYTHVIIQRSEEDAEEDNSTSVSLWKPISTSEDQLYTLKTDQFPGGSTTWTQKRYGDYSHFIEVSTGDNSSYEEGDKWYNDTLFRFIPPEVELQGIISNIKFSDNFTTNVPGFSKEPQRRILLHNRANYPVTRTISHVYQTQESLNLKIYDKIDPLNLTNGTLTFPNSRCQTSFQLRSTGISNPQVTHNCFVKSKITIPPKTSVWAVFYVDHMSNVDIPIEVKITIRGTGDGVLFQRGQYQVAPIDLPYEVLEERLREHGFASDFQGTDSANVYVSGNLKGSFVLDVAIVTEPYVTNSRSEHVNLF